MTKFAKGALVASAMALSFVGVASAQLTDAEFKCQVSTSKAGVKFVAGKTGCASKCFAAQWKVAGSFTDCMPPYGGTAATCILDPAKGQEAKFSGAILKACDPATKAGTDCPDCSDYNNGDCSLAGAATDKQQGIEAQIDLFGPIVFCETTGAAANEQKCMLGAAKALTKFVGAVTKCYDKCNAAIRKGAIPAGSCNPPTPSDAATITCVNTANTKGVAAVNKPCLDAASIPNGAGCGAYNPNGSTLVGLVGSAIAGTVPTTYCASPSGAFMD